MVKKMQRYNLYLPVAYIRKLEKRQRRVHAGVGDRRVRS